MGMFRKKPVVIEARQFDGENCLSLLQWMGEPGWDNPMIHTTDHPIIHTLEGDMSVSVGDWTCRIGDPLVYRLGEV